MRFSTSTSHPPVRRTKWAAARRLIAANLLLAGLIGLLFFLHLEHGPALTEVPGQTAARRDASIIFLSGDAGLRTWSLGGRVARQLGASGYTVTGIDSLAAFSTRGTRADSAAILARAMRVASRRNPGAPVVLIGQSFGSDIIPVAVGQLPPGLRAVISRIILIVPGTHAYLQVSPEEMAGVLPPDVDLAPLARSLPRVPITCIFGVEEADSLCPIMSSMPNVTLIGMPGGHPLNHDSRAVYAVVSRALRAPAAG